MIRHFIFLVFLAQLNWAQTGQDTLIVGYTSAPPFIFENEAGLDGINYRLWSRIADELEQPYVLQKMEFAQMLDGLRSGSIDVSINPLTITSERNREFLFTHSYYASNSTIAVAKKSSFGQIEIKKKLSESPFIKNVKPFNEKGSNTNPTCWRG